MTRNVLTQWERRSPRPLAYSLAAHVAAVFAIAVLFSAPEVRQWAAGSVSLVVPVDAAPHLESLRKLRGGGNGGQNQPLPASKGRPPRFDPLPLAAPAVQPPNPAPILAVEPALLGPSDTPVPTIDIALLGDPFAAVGPPSSGPGGSGGIGDGGPGGVGTGDGGTGLGPGGGANGVYTVGRDGVTPPRLIRRVEPEYSEEARKAKWQGVVKLQIEVWPDGRPHNIRVLRTLGLGLDEKAIQAVGQWTFQPGRRQGEAVRTFATVEVSFRLL